MTDGAVLVTGAGGFVCSEVALALHRADCNVLATDLTFDTATKARLDGIHMIAAPLDEALQQIRGRSVTAVVHGAAITASPERLGISHAAHLRRNMDPLTATLDFARQAGASSFLFISSMGVFDPLDGPAPEGCFTESTRPTATCAYCVAKQAGEALTTAAAEPGFATLSLRLGNVFGPHEAVRESRQHLCLVSRMIAEARETGVITLQSPYARREWAWLPDLAQGIAGLIRDMPRSGPRVLHAGMPPVLSDLDLARCVADRVGGTTIRLAPPPRAAVRPPMGTDVQGPFAATDWTPIETAIDSLTAKESAA